MALGRECRGLCSASLRPRLTARADTQRRPLPALDGRGARQQQARHSEEACCLLRQAHDVHS